MNNNNNNGTTMFHNPAVKANSTPEEILALVFNAMLEKGYDPVMQMVGYLMSGDPSYITSYNNARSLIKRVQRDEIIEMFTKTWIDVHTNRRGMR